MSKKKGENPGNGKRRKIAEEKKTAMKLERRTGRRGWWRASLGKKLIDSQGKPRKGFPFGKREETGKNRKSKRRATSRSVGHEEGGNVKKFVGAVPPCRE